MTTVTGAKPHPIFLAGTWVDSPDPLVVQNPADPASPAGSTYHATEAQYEEAVEDMLKRTDHPKAPWHVVAGDDKRLARVTVVETVCAAISANGERVFGPWA